MHDDFAISVSSNALKEFVELARRLQMLPLGAPDEMSIEHREQTPSTDWLDRLMGTSTGSVTWPGERFGGRPRLYKKKTGILKISNRHCVLENLKPVIAHVKELPFGSLVIGSLYLDWLTSNESYNPPGFSDGHFPHGFACAFKGSGHNRLVSRRWLKYGPWRLIRNEEQDFSFVQFHDLEADAETALEQAKPGHERMGITDHGGFLQKGYVYETDFDGIYLPDEEMLEIVVHGRKIPDVELLDACALRHYQDLGDDKPLKNVRYVFVGGEQQAREYLHELWLRELECWAIVDGQKVRLDEDYEPPAPEKPDWVTKVEDEETGV